MGGKHGGQKHAYSAQLCSSRQAHEGKAIDRVAAELRRIIGGETVEAGPVDMEQRLAA
jgi:hypothetical protein